MLRCSSLLALSLVVIVACSKKDKEAPATTGSGSASVPTGSAGSAAGSSGSDTGSAGAGSGSDAGSAAAGSGSDAGSATAGSGSGSADAGSGAAVKFDDLPTREDKVKFMKTKVMPAMKAAFQKFDPKEFANFTCKTCHGKDPQKSKYEMPNPELPKLDFEALKKGEDKDWVEFMENTVKPEMAKLLGEPEMTKDSPKGFGCLDCHTQKK
jgi:hypothetical protein